MNRDNIVCGNYSYGLFSLDYFFGFHEPAESDKH